MEFLPFEVTEWNDTREDKKVTLDSETGVLWVRIGKLDIEIKQTDDRQGVIIQALDAELCEQDLGSIQVWYDDIEELPKD
jgi:hypothetical protein